MWRVLHWPFSCLACDNRFFVLAHRHFKPHPQKRVKHKTCPETEETLKAIRPKADNNLNIEPTWKVAFRPSQSRNPQKTSSPKTKMQTETQRIQLESRNFPPPESRNLNF